MVGWVWRSPDASHGVEGGDCGVTDGKGLVLDKSKHRSVCGSTYIGLFECTTNLPHEALCFVGKLCGPLSLTPKPGVQEGSLETKGILV